MTPPGVSEVVATLLAAYGLKVGEPVEVELLIPDPAGRVIVDGRLVDALLAGVRDPATGRTHHSGELRSLIVEHAPGVRSVIPWHGVGRLIVHTALPSRTTALPPHPSEL